MQALAKLLGSVFFFFFGGGGGRVVCFLVGGRRGRVILSLCPHFPFFSRGVGGGGVDEGSSICK